MQLYHVRSNIILQGQHRKAGKQKVLTFEEFITLFLNADKETQEYIEQLLESETNTEQTEKA